MYVVGIMSGSSLDGLDIAICDVSDNSYELLIAKTYVFPIELEDNLKQLLDNDLLSYLLVEKQFTVFISECITDIISLVNCSIDLVSVHGHTCYHIPEKGITLQMVNGGMLSALCSYKVACDFRTGDIALGGVGTPIAPIVEKYFYAGYDYYLNLGGICNITISKGNKAFDICPCNQLLNYLANKLGHKYDSNGKNAMMGNYNKKVYQHLSNFEYYDRPAPKSLDNRWISDNYFKLYDNFDVDIEDLLHTTCHWICDRIVDAVLIEGNKTKMFLSGGGGHNIFLIDLLKSKLELKGIDLHIPNTEIIDYKESILMCLMAYLRVRKSNNILSSVTGSTINNIGGAIYNVYGK